MRTIVISAILHILLNISASIYILADNNYSQGNIFRFINDKYFQLNYNNLYTILFINLLIKILEIIGVFFHLILFTWLFYTFKTKQKIKILNIPHKSKCSSMKPLNYLKSTFTNKLKNENNHSYVVKYHQSIHHRDENKEEENGNVNNDNNNNNNNNGGQESSNLNAIPKIGNDEFIDDVLNGQEEISEIGDNISERTLSDLIHSYTLSDLSMYINEIDECISGLSQEQSHLDSLMNIISEIEKTVDFSDIDTDYNDSKTTIPITMKQQLFGDFKLISNTNIQIVYTIESIQKSMVYNYSFTLFIIYNCYLLVILTPYILNSLNINYLQSYLPIYMIHLNLLSINVTRDNDNSNELNHLEVSYHYDNHNNQSSIWEPLEQFLTCKISVEKTECFKNKSSLLNLMNTSDFTELISNCENELTQELFNFQQFNNATYCFALLHHWLKNKQFDQITRIILTLIIHVLCSGLIIKKFLLITVSDGTQTPLDIAYFKSICTQCNLDRIEME
ncbi:unnamed protein product [Trichobilharzia szidati]|nr:unnamed protein product [Trichobilharzia szidati]